MSLPFPRHLPSFPSGPVAPSHPSLLPIPRPSHPSLLPSHVPPFPSAPSLLSLRPRRSLPSLAPSHPSPLPSLAPPIPRRSPLPSLAPPVPRPSHPSPFPSLAPPIPRPSPFPSLAPPIPRPSPLPIPRPSRPSPLPIPRSFPSLAPRSFPSLAPRPSPLPSLARSDLRRIITAVLASAPCSPGLHSVKLPRVIIEKLSYSATFRDEWLRGRKRRPRRFRRHAPRSPHRAAQRRAALTAVRSDCRQYSKKATPSGGGRRWAIAPFYGRRNCCSLPGADSGRRPAVGPPARQLRMAPRATSWLLIAGNVPDGRTSREHAGSGRVNVRRLKAAGPWCATFESDYMIRPRHPAATAAALPSPP